MTDSSTGISFLSDARLATATRASTDQQLLDSWLDNHGSEHTRRNFRRTADQFLAALGDMGLTLRTATVEDVREALALLTRGKADSTARQYVLRVKALLSYATKLGYLAFNAGVAIRVKSERQSLAKRIATETEIGLLIRAARSTRDRTLIEVAYAGGLRVSEVVALTWADVIPRDNGRVQLNVMGKGGRVRQVLLPAIVAYALVALRQDAGANDPVFRSRKGGALTPRAVNFMIGKAAKAAHVNPGISAHWLRHAHGSHALDHGATLAEVQQTLGHTNVATTSAYLHARPDKSSGLRLDEGVFVR